MPLSRRSFGSLAASALLADRLNAQGSSRPDVAAIDRARILAAADRALASPIDRLTTAPPGFGVTGAHDFATAREDTASPEDPQSRSAALLHFTLAAPALAAAAYLTELDEPAKSDAYSRRAAEWLDTWFAAPATRMTPSFTFARLSPETHTPAPEGLDEGAALAEVAQAIPFLHRPAAVSAAQQTAWRQWFTNLAAWLDTDRLAGLARDRKDHTGSTWLLLRSAIAVLLADETQLIKLRHRFRMVTLRAEILADGTFPHELTTPTPYRNSLFNLDLLAGCANLLSTRFDSVWNYELQDGPGMRGAMARHAPWIANRGSWPYKADARFFNDLPARRPALLFAAHAFQQGGYADIWRTLDPDPTEPAILRSFPLRQPLLWTVRPRRDPDAPLR